MAKNCEPEFTPYEQDCLTIVIMTMFLNAGCWPSYTEMEAFPEYQHGREMARMPGEKSRPQSLASLYACASGRPDILRPDDLCLGLELDELEEWKRVWADYIKAYKFPFKVQDGLVMVRRGKQAKPPECDKEGFAPLWPVLARWQWAWMEDEALGTHGGYSDVERAWECGEDPRMVPLRCEGVRLTPEGGSQRIEPFSDGMMRPRVS